MSGVKEKNFHTQATIIAGVDIVGNLGNPYLVEVVDRSCLVVVRMVVVAGRIVPEGAAVGHTHIVVRTAVAVGNQCRVLDYNHRILGAAGSNQAVA